MVCRFRMLLSEELITCGNSRDKRFLAALTFPCVTLPFPNLNVCPCSPLPMRDSSRDFGSNWNTPTRGVPASRHILFWQFSEGFEVGVFLVFNKTLLGSLWIGLPVSCCGTSRLEIFPTNSHDVSVMQSENLTECFPLQRKSYWLLKS